LEDITLKDLEQIDEGIGHLVKIFGAQEIPPKPMLSLEVSKPKRKGRNS
jgi:hypothetical protein